MTSTVEPLRDTLVRQLQEIVQHGEGHALTWTSHKMPGCWMQVSVHGGQQRYLTVQFVRPPHVSLRQMNALFRQFGWVHVQADMRDCLAYYLARSSTWEQLQARVGEVATQCAQAMERLWGASQTEEVILLGARGPQLWQGRLSSTMDMPQLPS